MDVVILMSQAKVPREELVPLGPGAFVMAAFKLSENG
jgi:prefoldin subunit 5